MRHHADASNSFRHSSDLADLVQTDDDPAAFLFKPATLFPVLVTCILGAAISFGAWGARSQLSATSFTVLGVACKGEPPPATPTS